MTFLGVLWAFANSPLGVVLVLAVLGRLFVFIFQRVPEAQKLWTEHKGVFFDAVRLADEVIPDGQPGSAAAKSKAAFDYVLKLENGSHPAAQADPADIKHCLEQAHAAESAKPDQKE